jgi:PEP-CTERM motif
MKQALIGLFVLVNSACVYASPLINFKLEGRRPGSDDPFASNLAVSVGDIVEYRLSAQMAAPGTENQHLLNALPSTPFRHGINSLSLAIVQSPSDPIQVDFSSSAELALGWDRRVGAQGGIPTLRPGASWNDLLWIRPIQDAGVFVGDSETTVLSGLLKVASVTGASGELSAEWGAWSGGAAFEGKIFFITGPNWADRHGRPVTEASSDPFTHFTPLTLTAAAGSPVPEPSTLVMAASALAVLLLRRAFS